MKESKQEVLLCANSSFKYVIIKELLFKPQIYDI